MERTEIYERNNSFDMSEGSLESLQDGNDHTLDLSPMPKHKKIVNQQRNSKSATPTEKKVAFKDRYKIKNIICKGGQAHVRKAYDIKTKKDVAIKIYNKKKLQKKDYDAIY